MDNIIGKTYNHWTICSFSHKDKFNHPFYFCQCDCGHTQVLDFYALKYGLSKSCKSCAYKNRKKRTTVTINGLQQTIEVSKTRQYNIWCQMKQRCYNKNNAKYKDYGGRGIKICKEWKDNFVCFYKWSLENGYEDGLTIDRIDNDGNYTPINCRWVTSIIQHNNTRGNHHIYYKGQKYTISTFCRCFGLNETTTRQRIQKFGSDSPELLLIKDLRGRKQIKYFITLKGITKSLIAWCEEFGLNYDTILSRIKRYGYTPTEALTKKLKNGKSNPFLTC